MSKTTDKRALVAPQAVTTAAAIDHTAFGEAHAALVKATRDLHDLTIDYEGEETPEHKAKLDENYQQMRKSLDRTIGQPTSDPLQIAAKVALLWRVAEDIEVDPSDAEAAKHYIANGTDADHAVLAIYYDLLSAATAQGSEPRELTWDEALAISKAYKAQHDAWETATDNDDDRLFPDHLRQTGKAARAAIVEATAPHWAAVAEKARLLDYYDDADATGEPLPLEGSGFSYWLKRTIDFTASLGDALPSEVNYQDTFEAMGCVERMAREAARAEDGYQAYGCQPATIAEMAEVVACVVDAARELVHASDASHARALCLSVIVFPDDLTRHFNPERFVLLLIASRMTIIQTDEAATLAVKVRDRDGPLPCHPLAEGLEAIWSSLTDEQRQSVVTPIRGQG